MKRTIKEWKNCKPVEMSKMEEVDIWRALRDAKADIISLHSAIKKTLINNSHLADGDNCTLIDLKRAIDVD